MDQNEILESIAYNLKKYRQRCNLSEKELSEKSGINERFIIRMETVKAKRITLSKLSKIAEALGIKVYLLFDQIKKRN